MLKNWFTTVCNSKKQELLLPADTDQRDLVKLTGGLDIHSKLSHWLHSSRLCSLVSPAVQSTSQWTCSSGISKPVKCFDVIVRRDRYVYQNRRQKVFNRGALRFCGGALGLFGGAWHSKHWQKLNWFIVFHVSVWGGLELCLGGLSLQEKPVAAGLYLTRRDVVRRSRKIWRMQRKWITYLFCKCV